MTTLSGVITGVSRSTGFFCLSLMALNLFSCRGLEQKYIHRDKMFRIAFIEDTRAFDTLLINDNVLSDPDPKIRAAAALAIGRIGDTRYLAALTAYLRDTVPSVAEAKYFAAGLMGDSSLFDTLFSLALSAKVAREAAVEAMGRIAATAQAPQLSVFLDDPDSLVVRQAMLALWRTKEWSQAGKIAQIGLTNPVRTVQYSSLYVLSRGRRSEGRDLFRARLTDSDPEFRMLAYGGLGQSLDSSAVPLISAGFDDTDRRVVAAAMYALRPFGEMGARIIGEKLPSLQDEKLKVLGIEIIGESPGYKGAIDPINTILQTDQRDNVRAAAAKTLLQLEGNKAFTRIYEILPQPTNQQKLKIAEGLARVEPAVARLRVEELLRDPVPIVRATALESIVSIDSVGASSYVIAALNDTDYAVKATAIELAARLNLAEAIPTITEMYPERCVDLDGDLRRAIVGTWSNFKDIEGYDSLIIAALEKAIADDSYVIRKEAAQVLWDRFKIDRRNRLGIAQSGIEKNNYCSLFNRFDVNPKAILETSRGLITIELLYGDAPKTVNNFIALAESGFYDSRVFHRVVPNFVIQDGCPRGDGWGGPGYTIMCENNRLPYGTGTVGMALSGKDTGGSQFFITLSPQPHLDAAYTVFGRVIGGMETAQEIVRGDSIRTVTIQYPGAKK